VDILSRFCAATSFRFPPCFSPGFLIRNVAVLEVINDTPTPISMFVDTLNSCAIGVRCSAIEVGRFEIQNCRSDFGFADSDIFVDGAKVSIHVSFTVASRKKVGEDKNLMTSSAEASLIE
jgi:hypothetical protein